MGFLKASSSFLKAKIPELVVEKNGAKRIIEEETKRSVKTDTA